MGGSGWASKIGFAMSFWKSSDRTLNADSVEDFAFSPSGGRIKAWLLGIGLALLPIGYGISCIVAGHSTFFGNRGARFEFYGTGATVLAMGYIALGVFFHAHWFWGLHPKLERYSQALKILAAVVFLGSLCYTVVGIVLSWA